MNARRRRHVADPDWSWPEIAMWVVIGMVVVGWVVVVAYLAWTVYR